MHVYSIQDFHAMVAATPLRAAEIETGGLIGLDVWLKKQTAEANERTRKSAIGPKWTLACALHMSASDPKHMLDPIVSRLTGVDQRSVHRAVDRAVDRFMAHNVEPPVHYVQALTRP